MEPASNRRPDPAGRALQALERHAANVGFRIARSIESRWPHAPLTRRTRVKGVVERVQPPALEVRGERSDVAEIEVRDLRAELTRELDRLAAADIAASRGSGKTAR